MGKYFIKKIQCHANFSELPRVRIGSEIKLKLLVTPPHMESHFPGKPNTHFSALQSREVSFDPHGTQVVRTEQHI